MSYNDKIKIILNKLPNIEEIKLEDCDIYQEYAVVVLYKGNDSDIIICDNGYDAKILYGYLTERLEEFQAQNANTTQI